MVQEAHVEAEVLGRSTEKVDTEEVMVKIITITIKVIMAVQ